MHGPRQPMLTSAGVPPSPPPSRFELLLIPVFLPTHLLPYPPRAVFAPVSIPNRHDRLLESGLRSAGEQFAECAEPRDFGLPAARRGGIVNAV